MENGIGVIERLPEAVYNRIAAGEVIVSPAAVAKELMENAADAGATFVTVEIADGGKELIRVTDNGCGISERQLPLAVEKHATSKIHSFEDVYNLSSLGFRGEALASMAEVSRMTIASRVPGSDSGARLTITGGSDMRVEPAGLPEGTTVRVEDLFFNIPARRKFLKAASREGAQVSETVRRMILGRPDIGFKYIRNGKLVYNAPGDGSLRSAAASVYGSSVEPELLDLACDGVACRVHGVAGRPTHIFKNAQRIDFYVNGRYVQSKALQTAFVKAYGESLLHSHYPMGVIHLSVPPHEMDINVHPGKLTVMLFREEEILADIMEAVRSVVAAATEAPFVDMRQSRTALDSVPVGASAPGRVEDFWQKVPRTGMRMETVSERVPASKTSPDPEAVQRGKKVPSAPQGEPTAEKPVSICACQTGDSELGASDIADFAALLAESSEPDGDSERLQDVRQNRNMRILGTTFSSYVLCESEGRLFFIDQHAARERLTYEEILEHVRTEDSESQLLLIPVVRTFPEPEYSLLVQNKDLLGDMGVSFEPFGELTLRFFSFPVQMDPSEVDRFLAETAEELRTRPDDPVVARERLIASACRHSVKAGTELTDGEIRRLVEEICDMQYIPFCPHGRPIAVEITKSQLEKSFRRRT